jgi:hypothetical protein
MTNFTKKYLDLIFLREKKFMHENIRELKHPQWGSIVGYEDNIRLAVLKDEVAVFQSRIEPHDTGHLHTTIGTLLHRIDELEGRKPVSRSVEELTQKEDEKDL